MLIGQIQKQVEEKPKDADLEGKNDNLKNSRASSKLSNPMPLNFLEYKRQKVESEEEEFLHNISLKLKEQKDKHKHKIMLNKQKTMTESMINTANEGKLSFITQVNIM